MATAQQIRANRQNAQKSTGPKSDAGKARSRLNALDHGLRSEEVVLRSESKEDFEKHLAAWMADWNPSTMACVHLVERLAINAWRSRRITRLQTDRANQSYDNAASNFGLEQQKRNDKLAQNLQDDPAGTVAGLERNKPGLELLLHDWLCLEADIADPTDWRDSIAQHTLYLLLQGTDADDPAIADHVEHSQRLFDHNNLDAEEPDEGADPNASALSPAEFDESVAFIRRKIAERVAYYKDLCDRTPATSDGQRRYAESQTHGFAREDDSLRRYEGQLSRAFLADLKQLTALTAMNVDLPDAPPDPVAAPAPSEAKSPEPVAVVEPATQIPPPPPAEPAPSHPEIVADPAAQWKAQRWNAQIATNTRTSGSPAPQPTARDPHDPGRSRG